MMLRFILGLALTPLLFAQAPAPKGKRDPVKWVMRVEPETAAPGQKVLARLTATIEPGWYLYSLTTPRPSLPSTVALESSPAVAKSALWASPFKRKYDPNFKSESEVYEKSAEFVFEVEVARGAASGGAELAAKIIYRACTDQSCLLPMRRTATAALRVDPAAQAVAVAIPSGYLEFKGPPPAVAATPSGGASPSQPQPPGGPSGTLQFLAVALSFGFLAIFTPCVFPMIPITMSYFLSAQTGSRRNSVVQALTFCIGVIVLFTGLGAAVTAALGPFGLSQLGSNPWVNLFIALLLVAFALSLMGAFEITVPSSVLTPLSNASQRGGIAGTLLMGLAFALTSFACTGPFIGTLLASSTAGGLWWPVMGMLMFATGLASPFFFLALFPAYVNRLPKSGGWLARTKVTMGFFVLAASMKFFSNIDQVNQWHFLTRERYLAVWIVLFTLAGLYLLGLLKLPGHSEEPLSLWRLAASALSLILAVSLIPGMLGARLGELDAYVPDPASSPGGVSAGSGLQWLKNDYAAALAAARQNGKPLFVSLTGYACTNCHWMKTNMFPRPEISAALQNFVLLELYTDGTDQASEANQKLAETRFGTSTIPFYAVVRPGDDSIIETFSGPTRNVAEFEAFLTRALRNAAA